MNNIAFIYTIRLAEVTGVPRAFFLIFIPPPPPSKFPLPKTLLARTMDVFFFQNRICQLN